MPLTSNPGRIRDRKKALPCRTPARWYAGCRSSSERSPSRSSLGASLHPHDGLSSPPVLCPRRRPCWGRHPDVRLRRRVRLGPRGSAEHRDPGSGGEHAARARRWRRPASSPSPAAGRVRGMQGQGGRDGVHGSDARGGDQRHVRESPAGLFAERARVPSCGRRPASSRPSAGGGLRRLRWQSRRRRCSVALESRTIDGSCRMPHHDAGAARLLCAPAHPKKHEGGK
jgi:hypothetical protein